MYALTEHENWDTFAIMNEYPNKELLEKQFLFAVKEEASCENVMPSDNNVDIASIILSVDWGISKYIDVICHDEMEAWAVRIEIKKITTY